MRYVIGIDIGGTNIKAIIIDSLGNIQKEIRVETKDDGGFEWKKNVLEAVSQIKDNFKHRIEAIGLSAPGLPNKTNCCIQHLPNRLNGLENFDWTTYLNLKTYVLNDAHAATMAEKNFGVAKGIQDFILLTLGTGVGGGIVINGQLLQGVSQMAGHLGHVTLNETDTEKSILGIPGSLEYSIGNYSVSKRTNDKYKTTKELVEGFKKGEVIATYAWLLSIRKLAISLASLINILSPEVIILAGGITKAGKDLFEPLKVFLNEFEFQPLGKKTPILLAKYEDLSGALGAASFALEKINI